MSQTIRITAFRDGYRRAGMAHSTKPVEHPVDAFTAEQLAQLHQDRLLLVEEVASGEGDGDADNSETNTGAAAKKAAAKKAASKQAEGK